jgi:hypothetical protein
VILKQEFFPDSETYTASLAKISIAQNFSSNFTIVVTKRATLLRSPKLNKKVETHEIFEVELVLYLQKCKSR